MILHAPVCNDCHSAVMSVTLGMHSSRNKLPCVGPAGLTTTGSWLRVSGRSEVPGSARLRILELWRKSARAGMKLAAEGEHGIHQKQLFNDVEPEWVEVETRRVRV